MEQTFLKDYILNKLDDVKIAVDGVLAGLKNTYSLSDEKAYEMRLVMNELLNNCFHHAKTEGRKTVVLRVSVENGCAKICVKDNGQGFEYERTHMSAGLELSDDALYRENGRGLKLVRAFCDNIEYFGNGNSVRISIAL